jgi:ATP-binding cassette subfamily B protein
VIDNGEVVEVGTHEELLVNGELYADLYRTQFATTIDEVIEDDLSSADPIQV